MRGGMEKRVEGGCVDVKCCGRGGAVWKGGCERSRGAFGPGGARRGLRSLKRKGFLVSSWGRVFGPSKPARTAPSGRSQTVLQVSGMTRFLRDDIPLSKGSGSVEARQVLQAARRIRFARPFPSFE